MAPEFGVVDNTVLVHWKLAVPVVGSVVSFQLLEVPLAIVTLDVVAGPLQVKPPTTQERAVPEGITHEVDTQSVASVVTPVSPHPVQVV